MTKPTSEQVTFIASGASATQRTVLDKLRDCVSVKDFGAVGNGVANDTAAFNAAWTASNPHPVYVPPGTYLVTGSVGGSFYSFCNVTVSGGSVPLLQNAL
jgi:polygalacturonase